MPKSEDLENQPHGNSGMIIVYQYDTPLYVFDTAVPAFFFIQACHKRDVAPVILASGFVRLSNVSISRAMNC